LLDPGEYQIECELLYLTNTTDFVLAQSVGAGVQIAKAQRRQRLLLLPLEFRLGLTPVTQAFVNVPFGWSNTELSFVGQDEFDNTVGIGDVSAGVTRQFIEGSEDTCSVLGVFAFSAPTGESNLVTSLNTPGSSLGQGFWTVTLGLTCIRRYDPLVVFSSFGYQHRFEATFNGDIDVEPGNLAFCRLGVGYAVNPRVTLSTAFSGSFIGADVVNGRKVGGSMREPMQIRLAATISQDRASRTHRSVKTVEPFVTFGITEEAIDSIIGIGWTH
jgi:hypothetical protein